MKLLKDKLIVGLFTACFLALFGLVAVNIHQDAQAQIENRQWAPTAWYDYTLTNSIGFNSSGALFVRRGNTAYTGATTNVSLYGGATNVGIRLQIVNGVVTGITAY